VALQFHEHFRFDRPGSGANALLGQFAGLPAKKKARLAGSRPHLNKYTTGMNNYATWL
jgi:hypothetical protein